MSYLILLMTVIGGAFATWLIIVALFTPHLPYHIEAEVDAASDHLVQMLEASLQTKMTEGNAVEVLTNGRQFYPAMLDAIRSATKSVNLECYIFKPGEIGQQFIDALCDRAAHGVRVTVVLDAIGSFGTWRRLSGPLRAAGCRAHRYQRLTWYRLARLNNRTHREILVVDGRVAFAGGAGIADWWARAREGKPAWRDTMLRFEGPVVSAIQGIFAENWLECRGEILTGPGDLWAAPARGHDRRIRDAELALRSGDFVSGAIPNSCRKCQCARDHRHAVFSAGQGVPPCDRPDR